MEWSTILLSVGVLLLVLTPFAYISYMLLGTTGGATAIFTIIGVVAYALISERISKTLSTIIPFALFVIMVIDILYHAYKVHKSNKLTLTDVFKE